MKDITVGFPTSRGTPSPRTPESYRSIGHLRSLLESIPAHPDAIALCGSSAADPEIAGALRYELTARVVLVPNFGQATAHGAALLAADQVRQQYAEPARAPGRSKRLLLTAAALAAFLGMSGFAVSQVLDEGAPATNASSVDATSLSPPSSSTPTTLEAPADTRLPTSPAGSPRSPNQSGPPIAPAPPMAPSPGTPPAAAADPDTASRDPAPPTWVPAPEAGPTDASAPPSSPEAVAPSDSPTPAKVGAPGPQGLFPGESPPPASGSDPAAEQAWWANHWNLKRQWMNGG